MLRHAPNLPPLDDDAAALVETIRSDGVAYTTLDELDPSGAPALKRELSAFVASLAARDRGSESIMSVLLTRSTMGCMWVPPDVSA